MSPAPFYQPRVEDAAYQLRYSWSCWPSSPTFARQPAELIDVTKSLWEGDGLRVLEHRWTDEFVQILFSCTPDVSPQLVAARAKGRLDHALRSAGIVMPLSRKVAVRSVGNNSRRDVEAYIERQVGKRRFADPRFVAAMEKLTVVNDQADLSQATKSAHGRYWCNLHLVLVTSEHADLHDVDMLAQLRDLFFRVAGKKGHAVSRLSVLPDHLHAALRGKPNESPLEIVFAYQNNLAYGVRMPRLWSRGFYVGTFSEYTTQAVRNRAL